MMRRADWIALFWLGISTACEPVHNAGSPAPQVAALTATPPASASAPSAVKPAPFQNPGGLWLPQQIEQHAATLRQLGLKIDPKRLADPLSDVLGSIVRLNGCSASFVSKEGLIATNHHCAVGALQYNSTPERNLLKQGFVARSHAEELSTGPAGRAVVTLSFQDVSERVAAAIANAADDAARARAFEQFEKDTLANCEKGRPGVRCELQSFYLGLRYYLVEELELRDVRLVYAPPAGIGNFGGEVDNWRWPRHSGDFALFRAYVAPDGAPAEFASQNVGYAPAHHLALATHPLAEGDLVMVAGFPGRTSTFALAKEVDETVHFTYPRRLRMFEAFLREIEAVRASNAEASIKGTGFVRRFNNFRTKHQGELEGISRGKLLERKQADERALEAFISADPARKARYGGAIEAITQAIDERSRTREGDTALLSEVLQARLLWAACVIVHMAEERQKPDRERDLDYQDRKVKDISDQLEALDKQYHPLLDRALLRLALERLNDTPVAERSGALSALVGANESRDSIQKVVEHLYAGTKLDQVSERLALFRKATTKELAKSHDTLIRAALKLRPLLREIEERQRRYAGALLLQGPRYAGALIEHSAGNVAPDANGSLRISYGTVQGPTAGGSAFTRVSEIVAKHQGKEPFDAPAALLEAVKARRFAGYASASLGEVPVDFLSDVPITNGSSGSATLDAEGKLTGLAFDGTYDSVASDFAYQAGTRSIHVDIRYLLWVLATLEKADNLLGELGVPPR